MNWIIIGKPQVLFIHSTNISRAPLKYQDIIPGVGDTVVNTVAKKQNPCLLSKMSDGSKDDREKLLKKGQQVG